MLIPRSLRKLSSCHYRGMQSEYKIQIGVKKTIQHDGGYTLNAEPKSFKTELLAEYFHKTPGHRLICSPRLILM